MTGLVLDGSTTVGGFTLTAALEVSPGEVLAVLGANGAGKTTLLRVVCGLQALDLGRLTLGEHVWDDPAAERWVPAHRRGVGVVFQDHRLLPHLSVLDNVAFGLRRRGQSPARARRGAQEWLDRVGVGHLALRRPGQLSGGESQRVALARALVVEPTVVLLDEPTASVDPGSRHAIRDVVGDVVGDLRVPVLLVTHDHAEADHLATRHVLLDAGRIR